jgi:hypothetical protein
MSVPPKGDRKDFLTLKHALGLFRLDVSEECVKRCKSMVQCTGSRVPFLFQVIQERLHQGDIDLAEVQFLQRDPFDVTAEPQKESKYIAVRLDGVRTHTTLCSEIVG